MSKIFIFIMIGTPYERPFFLVSFFFHGEHLRFVRFRSKICKITKWKIPEKQPIYYYYREKILCAGPVLSGLSQLSCLIDKVGLFWWKKKLLKNVFWQIPNGCISCCKIDFNEQRVPQKIKSYQKLRYWLKVITTYLLLPKITQLMTHSVLPAW